MRTEVVGGVNLTGAAVGRWHRIGSYRRGCFGMRCLVFTGDAMGFVGETLERFGLVRAVALGLDGLSWPLGFGPSREYRQGIEETLKVNDSA
jgi:hypothetical protein